MDPPQGLANILNDLGLHTMQDVRLLNTPEQLELAESLRTAGVGLGSRSKLRRLSEATTLNSNVFRGCAPFDLDRHAFEGASEAARRLQESKLRESEGPGISAETLALIFTGVLAIAGYIFQARLFLHVGDCVL